MNNLILKIHRNFAKVAQLVERDLAKVEVAGSNPVFRSPLFKNKSACRRSRSHTQESFKFTKYRCRIFSALAVSLIQELLKN